MAEFIKDPYYDRPEVSNSDLSWVKKIFMTEQERGDIEAAYRFGTLVDCRITEPHKVDVYKRTCAGHIYTAEEMDQAGEMKKAFYRDPFCANLAKHCSFQKVTVRPRFEIETDGFKFALPMRCKWDLFVEAFDMSGDIKSTAATTLKQFEEAVKYFDYDRQRALYLDLAGPTRRHDVLIGISKKNYQVFKVYVDRASTWYKDGLQKYQDLAFRYWTMFGHLHETSENTTKSYYSPEAAL